MILQRQFALPIVCAIQQSWGSFHSGGEMRSLERIASLTPKLYAYEFNVVKRKAILFILFYEIIGLAHESTIIIICQHHPSITALREDLAT